MAEAREQIGVILEDSTIRKEVVRALLAQGFAVRSEDKEGPEPAAWLVDLPAARRGVLDKLEQPVIVLIDTPNVASASELISRGAVDCWLLPFDPDGHGARLEKILGDARLGRLGSGYGLAALLAHEMKSPIIAVLQQVMALERGLYGAMDPKAAKVLRRMHLRLDSLSGIIDEWLVLSKAMYGTPSISKGVKLRELLEQALGVVADQAAEKKVMIKLNHVKNLQVPGDAKSIELLLLNLLDNGVKYNRIGGQLDVDMQHDENWVRIVVSDNGPGIPYDAQEKIFQPFFRLDNERDVEGAGLGLSLVRAVAESHGGHVSLESAPGRGSRFTVSLPCHTQKERKGVSS